MLAAIGVLLTIFLTDSFFVNLKSIFQLSLESVSFGTIFYFILATCAVICFLLGILDLIRVLVPSLSTDSKKYSTTISPVNSIYYFEGISDSSNSDFEDKIFTMQEEEDFKDLINQVYINAKIATQKYHLYKNGVLKSTLGVAVLFSLYVIGLIVLNSGG